MKVKLLVFLGLILLSSAALANQSFPPCSSDVCTKVVHNKDFERLSVLVWNSKGELIHSNQFDLDSEAKLVHTSSDDGGLSLNGGDYYSTSNSGAPPAPCSTGACSVPVATSYETATEIVTIVITYTYHNGQLVGANTTRYVSPKAAEIDP
ncbi:hypothetical protein [Idiomarina sp. ST10R2A5]|uniref:hypothetical protein n=1 Tax=Idiomarina sp. ST10R2A5 TaxID=3418368 RepID=UPI003EC6B144